MLTVNYKNENMSGFVSDCLKDEEKKGLFILEFPVKRQGSQTGKILTDWRTLDDLELVLTIQNNGIQYIKDLYNNTYILKEDGSMEAINTSETKDATFVAVDVIQSFSNLEIIRRYKKYFKKLFFVSTRSAMSVYYKKFYKLDIKTQKIKKEITKNTKVNPEFTEDANYLTGVYIMQEKEEEMPSIEIMEKEEEMPSIEVMEKEEEMPSIEIMEKEEEMPSIEIMEKEEEMPSIEIMAKEIEMPSIEVMEKEEEGEEKSALVFCLAAKKYTNTCDIDELCDNVLKIVTNKEDDIPTETDEEIEKYEGAQYIILYFMTFLEEVYDYSYPDAEDIPLLKRLLYKAKDADIEEIKEKLKKYDN